MAAAVSILASIFITFYVSTKTISFLPAAIFFTFLALRLIIEEAIKVSKNGN